MLDKYEGSVAIDRGEFRACECLSCGRFFDLREGDGESCPRCESKDFISKPSHDQDNINQYQGLNP